MVYIPENIGEAVLVEIERVPWASLKHAHGRGAWRTEGMNPFTKQPLVIVSPGPREIVEALAAPEGESEDDLEDALGGLYESICHQGSLYEVTAHVIPYAAAIAADARHRLRVQILQWLLIVFAAASHDIDAPDAGSALDALRASARLFARGATEGSERERRAFRWLEGAVASAPTRELSNEADDLANTLEEPRPA